MERAYAWTYLEKALKPSSKADFSYHLKNTVNGHIAEVLFSLEEDLLARQRATCSSNEFELRRNSMFIQRGETAQQFWVRIAELKRDMLIAGMVMTEEMEVETFINGVGKILRDTTIENGMLKLDFDQSSYINFVRQITSKI